VRGGYLSASPSLSLSLSLSLCFRGEEAKIYKDEKVKKSATKSEHE
jgi:hypothetical protein